MAELTINVNDITAALKKNLEGFSPSVEAKQVGLQAQPAPAKTG